MPPAGPDPLPTAGVEDELELVGLRLLHLGGLSREVLAKEFYDLVQGDLLHPLLCLPAWLTVIGEQLGIVAAGVDAQVGAAQVQVLDMRQEVGEGGIGELLPVDLGAAVLEDGCGAPGLWRVDGYVHLLFHEDQDGGLIAGFALGLHLDAGLLQVLFAVFAFEEVVLVAGPATQDDVAVTVHVPVGEAPPFLPQPGPVAELKAPLAAFPLGVLVAKASPEVADGVDQEEGAFLLGLADGGQQIDEGSGLGHEERDVRGIEARLHPVGAGFGVQKQDRLVAAWEPFAAHVLAISVAVKVLPSPAKPMMPALRKAWVFSTFLNSFISVSPAHANPYGVRIG